MHFLKLILVFRLRCFCFFVDDPDDGGLYDCILINDKLSRPLRDQKVERHREDAFLDIDDNVVYKINMTAFNTTVYPQGLT